MARMIVTGCAGFIASHLCDRLIEDGHYVIGIDNLINGKRDQVHPLVDFHEMDIRNPLVADIFNSKIDVCFHQAALGSIPRSIEDPTETRSVNVDGFQNILKLCEINDVKLIYASSSSVYGDDNRLPKVEERIGKQTNPYSESKRVNELMASASTIPNVGLRYFNVFGPRQREDVEYSAVIPRWITALRSGENITIHGDGSALRDFTYINNVVYANILAIDSPYHSEVYNVATGHAITIHELLIYLKRALGLTAKDLSVTWDKEKQVVSSMADISKIETHLGYLVDVDTISGISRTVHWHKSKDRFK